MAELQGRIAIVTGAASGIGEACASTLAREGAHVVVADLDGDGAQRLADELRGEGLAADAATVDMGNVEQIGELVGKVVDDLGGVDILHNNAALTGLAHMNSDDAIHEIDLDVWDRTMAVNLRGYLAAAKHVIPSMLTRGGGVIVNTSSGLAGYGDITHPAYGTSKSAIVGLTRNIATQYGRHRIRCVGVAPGPIRTPAMVEHAPQAVLDMMLRHQLLPDPGVAQDIADAVAFLVSDRAKFITGITLNVDGGFSSHVPTYAERVG